MISVPVGFPSPILGNREAIEPRAAPSNDKVTGTSENGFDMVGLSSQMPQKVL